MSLVQSWSNQGWKDALMSTISELSFESGLGTHLRDKHGHLFFMRFGTISALVQGLLNQGWKYALLSTLSELTF